MNTGGTSDQMLRYMCVTYISVGELWVPDVQMLMHVGATHFEHIHVTGAACHPWPRGL